MLHFESPHVRVLWDEKPGCVHTEWHGFVSDNDLKVGLHEAFELARAKRAKLWISDLRDMHVYTQEDQQWIMREFFPKLQSLGIKKMAFVTPKLPVTLMSISRIVKNCDPDKQQSAFFEDLPTAYAWLEQGVKLSNAHL